MNSAAVGEKVETSEKTVTCPKYAWRERFIEYSICSPQEHNVKDVKFDSCESILNRNRFNHEQMLIEANKTYFMEIWVYNL